MKKIKTLYIEFEGFLAKSEVSGFRGAVIEKVGRENVAFHNHIGNSGFVYKYPLIQYKSDKRNPGIFCLSEGVEEIYKLFDKRNLDINVNGRKIDLKVSKMNMNQITLNTWDKLFDFSINNWLPLNSENFIKFKNMESTNEQIAMLEKIMISNIISFAKGVEWDITNKIELNINQIRQQKTIRYKGTPLIAFDLEFKSNVFLPNHIGLGKGVSHGFGILKQIKTKI